MEIQSGILQSFACTSKKFSIKESKVLIFYYKVVYNQI